MIHKSTTLSAQLRNMEIGQSFVVNARSGIKYKTLEGTATRLRKEGYCFSLSVVGLPKGSCRVTRIEPRPERTDHQIVVLKAICNNHLQSTKSKAIATTLEVDYTQGGTPEHTSLSIIYDQYEHWQRRLKEGGTDAANRYIAKLIEDTLQ